MEWQLVAYSAVTIYRNLNKRDSTTEELKRRAFKFKRAFIAEVTIKIRKFESLLRHNLMTLEMLSDNKYEKRFHYTVQASKIYKKELVTIANL